LLRRYGPDNSPWRIWIWRNIGRCCLWTTSNSN